jgi:hypothetical protein
MKLGQIMRKLRIITALIALVLASIPALAESLSASELSSCCTTAYCPLHHRNIQDLQRDKNNCDSHGQSAGNDCSMRACDMAPNPSMGTALFTLAAPMSIAFQTNVEPAPGLGSRFFPFHLNFPTTPPPRTLPN